VNRRELLKISGAAAVAAMAPGISLAEEIGVDQAAKTVNIGGFTPITGPVPFYAILTHAADAYFKSVNDQGGVNGWKINYMTLDDGYDPARSIAVARRLVEEDHIFALVASVGTATNVAVIPYAKENNLAMLGPIGGASAFFSEPNIFPLLPDYGWSAAANAEYALGDLKLKKVALLWENDELGRSAKRGFDLYMDSMKTTPAESIPFEVKTTDFTPHLRRLVNSGAEAAILFGSNANLAGALKAADRQGTKLTWFAPFFTADPSTYKLAGDLLEGVYFSSWLLPVDSDEPEVKAYRGAAAKYYPHDPVGVFGLNGWSNAALFGVLLKAMIDGGQPITRASLIAAGNALKDASVGGARNVTFTVGDHRGTRQEAILQAKDKSFVMVRDFKPYPSVAFDAKPT
jgi:branched-chain amino acid transport system substrate-binding protein